MSWAGLAATGETTRTDDEGYIVSKTRFTPQVKRLEGKRIRVAGWMTPLATGPSKRISCCWAIRPDAPRFTLWRGFAS